ncbi:RNA polymerase sigma factor [Sphingobacterium spiritivorum]|uniref:RNA polymerase sigma factor n=1 Tax=Sphingobacterium spiritivorum TaxID=258 RepID=UPI00191AFCEC|nr:sigma-70 family RNA polymerase sigma factor [Sphingobacterium spiritivorum]QQT24788.1 sigma-70 family RNA polymerase sigma factor [Sphingobacterium spiritivorum]
MNTWSDKELFDAIKKNNTQAFSILFDRYSDILFRFILKRTRSVTDTEDILQEVFLSLWNRRANIEVGDSIYPYLFKAARYEVIDWMVKSEKRVKHFEQLQVKAEKDIICLHNTEDKLMAQELAKLLEDEVQKMPVTMRSIFNLSRGEDMCIKDIASQLSISEQTVKNNISLAMSRLRILVK